jgi:hypothetical protein
VGEAGEHGGSHCEKQAADEGGGRVDAGQDAGEANDTCDCAEAEDP